MKIGACIITYNPDILILKKGVESLQSQVDKIVIVDNGSANLEELCKFCHNYSTSELISLGENKGIAFATNVALKKFVDEKYDYVLTSDQDSNYPSNYIENFICDKNQLNDDSIAVFVPVFYDQNENDYADIIVESKFFIKRKKMEDEFADVFHAIASGMIISISMLNEIGFMNEDLFIDWVDLEWCWRVRYYRKRIVCCKNLTINHKLGDSSKDIGFRKVSIRSHIRNYYITRNSFYLSLYTKFLNKKAKFILFFKSFRYIVGYTFLCENHMLNLRYTLKGMYDGVRGNLGRIKK